MSYRNTVETKVADFVVGQYVIFPTTGNGTWSGIFEGFGEPLGQYAPEGAVNVMVRYEDTGEVHTLRSSRLYSGYMTPVEDEHEDCAACAAGETSEHNPEPEPQRFLYEVQVPVQGEVIFTVEAASKEEAEELATAIGWGDGELNLEHDYALPTHVETLGEA